MNNSEAIIIGGDHHNTLAIMRCLGKKNILVTVLIHTNSSICSNDISINHSKYSKKLYIVKEDEESMLQWLLENKKERKQIIFPASDFAEYVIDNNYKLLSNDYIIPGFKDKPGFVVKLMNKYEQKKWADCHNIPMAKTLYIKKINGLFEYPNDIEFPCILKPCISAFGSKSDIHISYDKDDFIQSIETFNSKNYNELIIQSFIKKDYELCAIGCIVGEYDNGQIIKKIRENPPQGGGSLTFAKFIDDERITTVVSKVINELKIEKYNGLYDIEFLVCGDNIYLNEINFRHSGNGYALIKSGVLAPYIVYLYFTKKIFDIKSKKKLIYFIDDFNELSSLNNRYINFITFLLDFFRANAHSVFSLADFGVFKYKISKLIVKKLGKHEKK